MAVPPVGLARFPSKVYLIISSFFAIASSGTVRDPLGTSGALPFDAATHAAAQFNVADMPAVVETGAAAAEAPKSPPSPQSIPSQQALAIGASANTVHVPAVPHAVGLANVSPSATQLGGLSSPVDASSARLPEDHSISYAGSMMRREVEAPALSPRRTIMPEAPTREHLRRDASDSGEEEPRHKYPFQSNPHLTPEAIFANHQLAPDVAEFLGHLAQRARVHRKELVKSSNEAGLMQGEGKATTNDAKGEDDDMDDIEDMKRQAAGGPKATALSHFFEVLDSKITAGSWSPAECAAISKNVSALYAKMKGRSGATWATAGPASASGRTEIHTGMFFRHWNMGTVRQAARRLRLGVLSFLATQDAGRVRLHIWTDLDSRNSSLREILGPIAYHPELMDAISITQFDPKLEFAKVPPSLAKQTLTDRYKEDDMPHLRQDLLRSVILYNYGGVWMDADTVLLQDIAPLIGEDWAYLGRRQGSIEGAILSASKPASRFANEYLIGYVMKQPPLEIESFSEAPLLVEVFNNDPSHTTLHVLPPCFLDSDADASGRDSAVLASDASPGSAFFEKVVAESYRSLFSAGIRDAIQDQSNEESSVLQGAAFLPYLKAESDLDEDETVAPPVSPSFAYHWRGNYRTRWAKGSLADVAERTFMKKLNIRMRK